MWSWSIQSACALGRERFALLCYEDDVAYDDPQRVLTVRLVEGRAPARTVDLRGEYVRICQLDDAKASVAVLSSEGALALIDLLGVTVATEHISVPGQPINPYGSLTTVRQIGGRLYACGMGGQVYQRTSPNDWRLISKELCSENIYERWFSNIDGKDDSYLFAAGLEGSLFFFDGRKWDQIQTHTTVPLGEMAFMADGDMYVAGTQSVLLHGSPQVAFNKIGLMRRDLTLYTIARYRDRIFIGTEYGVYEFDASKQKLLQIDMRTTSGEIMLLQSVGDVLWAFGSKYVRRYDGTNWVEYDQNL